jgi:hypothetical protein
MIRSFLQHKSGSDRRRNKMSFNSSEGKMTRKNFALHVLTLVGLVLSLIGPMAATPAQADTITFTGEELLGKPTDTSITINIVPNSTIEYYYEYGTSQGGPYPDSTLPKTATGGQPDEVVIVGLSPNTRYYYRMIYDGDGDVEDGDYEVRDEHTFHTQRAPGSTFKFTIVADSHAYYNTEYHNTMENVRDDEPDFHFDLGDTFMTDNDTSQSQVNAEYLAQRGGDYMDLVGHSSPIFLASGNHENEEGWNFDDTPFSIALASVLARKLYYPTPIDDGFYSGNTDPLTTIDAGTYGDQYREDYYAWTWGDALFVVLDPYHYTMQNPYGATAGESNDETVGGDGWNWTLGEEQYQWFKDTLEGSDAKYKFVLAHHVVGGMPSYLYVRGGAEAVPYYEWGGNTWSGTWQFDTERSGWDTPVHQLMVDNGVSAFFHGHDHQYAYEVRDGIVYQCLPRPTTGMDFNYYSESDPYTIEVLPSPGHLRVTVSPTEATVDYVGTSSGTVNYSYTIEAGSEENAPPVVSDIPNQTIAQGGTFATINLDDYVSDLDNTDAEMTWTYAGNTELSVDITDRVATITTPDAEWIGSETITFTATDPGALDDSDDATFTVTDVVPGVISYIGDIGSATSTTQGSSLVINTTSAVTAGDDIIVAFATYGDPDYEISVTDEAGNTYEEAGQAVCYTHGRTYIFAAYNVTALPSGSDITITHTAVDGATTAVASVFRGLADVDPLDQSLGNPAPGAQEQQSGTTPTVGPTGTTAQASELLIGSIGTEGPVGDNAGTWDYGFTAGPRAGTTGGTATDNWTVSMGWRIVSVTGEYTAQKSGITDRYWAAAIATFRGGPAGLTHDLSMAVDPVGSGTTNPAVGVHAYAENAVVDIIATPNAGYMFDHWTGAVADVNSAATTVTMNEDKTVTAHFTEVTPSDISGDVNGDDTVNSTDALVILSCDVGINTSQFCPMNCGDINADGAVNSTDALIILSHDVGMTVPFPVGEPGCPSSVTPCPGCTP